LRIASISDTLSELSSFLSKLWVCLERFYVIVGSTFYSVAIIFWWYGATLLFEVYVQCPLNKVLSHYRSRSYVLNLSAHVFYLLIFYLNSRFCVTRLDIREVSMFYLCTQLHSSCIWDYRLQRTGRVNSLLCP
jgi:hypothetical protein